LARGIKCLVCGKPIWGTLPEAAPEKGDATADLPSLIFDRKSCLEKDSN